MKTAHKYFACSSLLCMIMAIYSGHKMISGKSRKKKDPVSEEAHTITMSTMTQPLSYEIITPGGYVMDKITHKVRCEQWTAIVNECLASGMLKTT